MTCATDHAISARSLAIPQRGTNERVRMAVEVIQESIRLFAASQRDHLRWSHKGG